MNIDSRGWSGVLLRTIGGDGQTATRARGEARPGRRHDAPIGSSTDVYQPSAPVVPAIPLSRSGASAPAIPLPGDDGSRGTPTVGAGPWQRPGTPSAPADPVTQGGGVVSAAPVPRDPVVSAAPVPREPVSTGAPVLPAPERPADGLVVAYRPSAR